MRFWGLIDWWIADKTSIACPYYLISIPFLCVIICHLLYYMKGLFLSWIGCWEIENPVITGFIKMDAVDMMGNFEYSAQLY